MLLFDDKSIGCKVGEKCNIAIREVFVGYDVDKGVRREKSLIFEKGREDEEHRMLSANIIRANNS